jgi:hypothetical protein
MALGLTPVKAEVDSMAGVIARELQAVMSRIEKFKFFLDSKTVEDLESMGYTTTEANTLKSAYADAAQLAALFEGSGTLGVAKDFRAFLRQVWGLGSL